MFEPEPDQRRTFRILLVEDNPGDVRLIREGLKPSSASVWLASVLDGVEALEYLHAMLAGAHPRPDLVLLDLNLPRKGGREVLIEIKSHPELRSIPVLVMSSSTNEDDVNSAYELAANGYIAKPADLSEYMGMVRTLGAFWFRVARLPNEPPALMHPQTRAVGS
jgi:two-component system, chemotaxis family, response regulator Rcp1